MPYVSACLSTCFVIDPFLAGSLASFEIHVPFYAATVSHGLLVRRITLCIDLSF